jgi:hypothetical protein
LGLVPASNLAGAGAWWTGLEETSGPKIIARLPFVERADHPASIPLFVLSRPIVPDAAVTEVQTWSVQVAGWSAAAARVLAPLADVLAVPRGEFDGAALLISLPPGRKIDETKKALLGAGVSVRGAALVGGHATRYTV